MVKRKKLKKLMKVLGAGAAIAGLGKAFMNNRARNAMISGADANDGFRAPFKRPNMLDIAGAISKPRGTILPKKRRDSVLAKPGINRMDLSEVDMDYQAPDMSGYRNMDMGLEGYYKDGGKVVKTGEKTTKLKKKKSIQIKGFGKARR